MAINTLSKLFQISVSGISAFNLFYPLDLLMNNPQLFKANLIGTDFRSAPAGRTKSFFELPDLVCHEQHLKHGQFSFLQHR
jgi:hypothetical protein